MVANAKAYRSGISVKFGMRKDEVGDILTAPRSRPNKRRPTLAIGNIGIDVGVGKEPLDEKNISLVNRQHKSRFTVIVDCIDVYAGVFENGTKRWFG
jgi:hypothetical protein